MSKKYPDYDYIFPKDGMGPPVPRSTVERNQRVKYEQSAQALANKREARQSRARSIYRNFTNGSVYNATRLVFNVAVIALAFGLFNVLLGNNFDFTSLGHTILSTDFALFPFDDFIRWCHDLLPSSTGVFGTLVEDILILGGSIVYVFGFLIQLVVVVFSVPVSA